MKDKKRAEVIAQIKQLGLGELPEELSDSNNLNIISQCLGSLSSLVEEVKRKNSAADEKK